MRTVQFHLWERPKLTKITVMTEISIVVALEEKWGAVIESGRGSLSAAHVFFLHCILKICELFSKYDRLIIFKV